MRFLGHLDINVVTHCNFRCAACSHASPFYPRYFMHQDTMSRDLEAIKPFLHFSIIQLVGGEPTLHPDLDRMIEAAKESRVGNSVSVITNGSLLDRMPKDFWQALEILQISLYPSAKPGILELAQSYARSFGFALHHTVFTEFYKQLKRHPDDGVESFKNCCWKTDCYTLHEGRFYLCPQSTFFPHRFMGLPEGIDGLPLDGLTEEKLEAFLDRKTPFNACRICCANLKRTFPWTSSKTEAEWKEASTL